MADAPQRYAQREDWSDVTPLKQYEGPTPLAPIFYTEEYQDATDYFRGIVKTGETSERVLQLTEHIICMNPAHYTAWQYRFKTLIAIGASLDDERALMDVLAVKFLKNYQVWHHRRMLLGALREDALRTPPGGDKGSALRKLNAHELAFVGQALKADEKNYHTWSYRQWILTSATDEDAWAGEIPFVEHLLEDDIRNNSAWHHRFFTVWSSGVRQGDEDLQEVLKRELRYVKRAISLAPNNPSAWNYLRGILEHNNVPFTDLRDFASMYAVAREPGPSDFDETDLDNPAPSQEAKLPCPAAIEFMAEIYKKDSATAEKAVQLYERLAEEHDVIRKRYWQHRIAEVRESAAVQANA